MTDLARTHWDCNRKRLVNFNLGTGCVAQGQIGVLSPVTFDLVIGDLDLAENSFDSLYVFC